MLKIAFGGFKYHPPVMDHYSLQTIKIKGNKSYNYFVNSRK